MQAANQLQETLDTATRQQLATEAHGDDYQGVRRLPPRHRIFGRKTAAILGLLNLERTHEAI